MTPEQNFHVAWARLDALRKHPPSLWDQRAVQDYNGLIQAFEDAAPGEDLSAFRVPESELEPRVTGFTRGTRRGPGKVFKSEKLYCDTQRMLQRIEGVASYFINRQPQPDEPVARKIGF
jgi:hypothetical protein